tara:strand:+ start:2312 stop:15007 length:12696 start_codon:yes stop_codon:yes gene_type:complete
MISTGIDKRVKVQQIIENQLPEFILSESPKTADFLKQYYISQEYTSGPIDLVDNLDQYLKLDNLTPEVIKGYTNLSVGIGTADKTISVTSTKGYPNEYGLLKIGDEIITYTGSTTNSFTGCERGFSGITSYRDINNPSEIIFSDSSAGTHVTGSKVQNLSALFLQEFYKKLKIVFTPGLENSDFVSELDVNNFIKEARTFYEAKGTEESFRILFNILYGVNPKVIDLEKYLVKPSSARYVRRERIVAEKLSGNPLKLQGQTITRSTDSETTASISEVEQLTGVSGISTSSEYFILDIFVGFNDEEFITGIFDVTGKTKVVKDISKNSKVITVDSTIGFGATGTVICGFNTNIQYTDKTVNQFLNCSNIDSDISLGDNLIADDNVFGFEDGDLTKKVELRLTGVLKEFVPSASNKLSLEGETITVKSIGELIENPNIDKTQKEIFANSWIYNTSSTYDTEETISGKISTFKLRSTIEDSSLKKGDTIQFIKKTSDPFSLGRVIDTAIISSISRQNNTVTLNKQISDNGQNLGISTQYSIRRVLKTASSANDLLEFADLTSDVQNVYNESDENLYVASGSLPSYQITKNIGISSISSVVENDTIQDKNTITDKYSTIAFDDPVPFITGDKIFYEPKSNPLVGISSGFYFVKNVDGTKNKIKLFQSPAFIASNSFIEFGVPKDTNTQHNFILADHYDKKITSQKLLKKFPIDVKQNLGKNVKTIPGSVGMLKDGTEIENGRSRDSIFYGSISNFSCVGFGTNYDIINPPLIDIVSSGSTPALVSPVISGDIREILVDQQNFDIENITSIKITGGNSGEAILQPILSRRNRVLEFSGVTSAFGGGIDTNSETLTFIKPHNLVSGQILIYDRNKNTQLGIGSFKGSNVSNDEFLIDGQPYWPEVIGLSTVRLFRSENDYVSGINTIGFTNIAKDGIHKFRIKDAKNNLTGVRVIQSGKPYLNRKVFASSSTGISTEKSIVTFNNHGFSNGEIVEYKPHVGLGTTTPQSITGLSTLTQYKIIKIDDNNFRVSNVGVGTLFDNSNFISGKYVSFKSKGTGYQLFKYPDIQITVDALYSVSTSEKIVITPVVQGEIIDVSLYDKGSGYGRTDIINYENKPNIVVKNGTTRPSKNITPSLSVLIDNGKITQVNIQDGGDEYHSTPDLKVIGDGVGAKLRAVVDRDENSQTFLKIIDVVIINGGSNYTFDNTRINVIPRGSNAVFNVSINELHLNNIQSIDSNDDTTIAYNAKYSNEKLIASNNGLKYSVVGYSTQIGKSEFGQEFGQTNANHSPIVGWAYDGNPIYGPFGYSDPLDINSSIKILETGYSINSTIENRSDLNFPLGFFADDFSYTPTSTTDLDQHNGRFSKTPEYPNGVYAYFVGIDTVTQKPKFPYFIGHTYRSIPETLDTGNTLSQSFNFNNSKLVRNTFPYKLSDKFADNDFIVESDELLPQLTKVTAVSQGKVDSLTIIKSGENYNIGDTVTFDNSGTDGGGISASVSKLDGKPIFNVDTSFESLNNVIFTHKNQNIVSVFVPNTHQLSVGNNLEISGLSTDISSLDGLPLSGNKIVSGITSESTVLYKEVSSNATAGVITDIYVYQTNVISVGSSIGIGTEKLLVLNKFDDRNILRVKRGVTGTAHTLSSRVNLIPNSFDINFKTASFESKINDVVYFNPRESIGLVTTVGFSSAVTVSVGDTSRQVSIPDSSIFLPNHPFKTGQEITFKKPPSGGSSILVSNNPSSSIFSLPLSGSSQTVFAINKSKDFIGIATQVGLTTTNGLFFRSNGDNDFEYAFESNFAQVTGNLERINSKVTLTTSHSLSAGDTISLNIAPNQSVGIGTSVSVRVKYESTIDSLLINEIGFSSTGINTSTNIISLNSHGLKTGDKVYYDAVEVASGLETGGYFVYKIDDNQIKLAETLYNSNIIPPKVVNIISIGATHTLSLINPPISVTRNNNLVFDLSDSSLSNLDFKIYQDQNFDNDFISTGATTINVVSTSGTIGVTSTASLTLNYSSANPQNLFYNVEKSGFISTSDVDVANGSKISYENSKYNRDYSIVGIGETTFDIRLSVKPENLLYTSDNTNTLEYSTSSKTERGSINNVRLDFGGEGYKALPKFVSVASTTGINAKILPDSTSSNQIENTEIINIGFEYSSDKTLKPLANVCPVITIKNSDKITSVNVSDGGKNYLTPPTLIVVDTESKEVVNTGSLEAKLSQATQSINSVDIISPPRGVGEVQIFSTDNTNGVQITNIAIGGTIVTDTLSGLVTFTLATPILGFSSAPFKVGDTLFVENVENEYGNTFNSPNNQFKFYPVTRVIGGSNPNPFKFEINLNGLVTNPGLAKTLQTFGSVINFNNYPKFDITTDLSPFSVGENILVSRNNLPFERVDLVLNKLSNNYIKIVGSFNLKVNDKVKGAFTGSVATINSLFQNKGEFIVDYSSKKEKGWSDDIGKLNEDYQVLPDNDYYQNLSYTIQSPIEYTKLVSPVNKLLHTTGLKNFADVGISSSVGVGTTISVDSSTIIRDLSSENRVDAIDNFDLVKDVNILSNPKRSKFINFQNKKLANFFECNTNNAVQIDDISTLFSDSSNNAKTDGTLSITDSFNRFLIQTKVPLPSTGIAQTTSTLQVTEIITSVDFINKDIYTIEKSSINNQFKIVDIIGEKDDDDNYNLKFNPVDVFNNDLDIKILENRFLTGVGVGVTDLGFVSLTGNNTNVSASSTSTIISSNISTIESYFATISVKDDTANENNVIELYVTHDGTNSYISNYSLETNTGNSIGTFTSEIDSGVLSLNYENDRSNQVLVRSKIVGFGTTASGIGTHRFKLDEQSDGSENSARLESKFVSIGSTATICGFTTSKDTTVKSIVRVSIGQTSALHQVLMTHDGSNSFITQYPFISIGTDVGIGTFSTEFSGTDLNLKFHPDSNFIGVGDLQVQSYNEVINTALDLINTAPSLTYGKSIESLSLLQFNSLNGDRSSVGSFRLRSNNNFIFANFFNPSVGLNTVTGQFIIENNFFNRNERLIYEPGSSLEGVSASSLVMSDGNPLPSEVYVSLSSGTTNSNVFGLSTTRGGSTVTFNNIGSGNRHKLEMFKKNEKALITLDNVIQSPLSFTPITTTVANNISGQVSITTSIISLSGITSIVTNDILKINDEFVRINNVGFGTTSVGPISNTGSLNLIDVTRASVGSTSSTHADGSSVRLFKGGYNIVGDSIFFTNPPRGTNVTEKNDSNRVPSRASFTGRVFLRQDYSSNAIFDDVSHEFTGIAQTFRTSISGVNTTGLTTGSSFLTINGIFQRPTTEQNPLNNYDFSESAGITSFVFSGISSTDGTQIINEFDVNQNQLPRAGQIISIGYSGGLGYAPLAGAAVTAFTNSSGTITAVGVGTRDFHGSGYRSGLSTSGNGIFNIDVIDEAYDHRFKSSSPNSITVKNGGIGADTTFTPIDAPYTSSTGIVTITKNNHNLITSDSYTATTGTVYDPNVGIMTVKLNSTPSPTLANNQLVKFDNNSFTFTCDKDEHATNHSYPRTTDPVSGKWLPIFNVTGGNQFEINVLQTIPSSNIGVHTFVSATPSGVKRSANKIRIATNSLVYTCDKDAHSTDHAYPRSTDPAYNTDLNILEATDNYFMVGVGTGGGAGTGANITATVGVGGSLSFTVVGGGTGYINPVIMPPSPRYENLPVTGVSRVGLGATTDTGTGLLLTIDVGGSNTTGIGSTLFEVKSFETTRSGYGFRKGDVFTPVGLVTDKSLSSPLSEIQFTVNEVFTDTFCSWNVGEFDYIDNISKLQDGTRTVFPLNFKGELVSFQPKKGSNIDMQSLLLIFVNGVLQNPGEAYIFNGGTRFQFTEAPDDKDDVSIFFYKGSDVDITFVDVDESIKTGDELQILGSNTVSDQDQNRRTVVGITTADTVETEFYFAQGINDLNSKPVRWIKQKSDKFIAGQLITKIRPLIEPLVFPEARIIKDVASADTTVYLDTVDNFFYDSPSKVSALIADESITRQSANLNAVVSVAGTIQSITVTDGGSGYVGATTSISIGVPTTGINTNTAEATGSITSGIITSVTITNPGIGYTSSSVPNVIAPVPVTPFETITGFTTAFGFSGIVTGITVLSSSTIKFFLDKGSGAFTGLANGDPIYIYDTAVGSGATSTIISSGAPVGVGTTFFDNIYIVSSLSSSSNLGEFVAGVKTDTSIIGIATENTICGKFSWGKLSGGTRSSTNPLTLTVSGNTVNSGLSTFPRVQRRAAGLRETGAIKDST